MTTDNESNAGETNWFFEEWCPSVKRWISKYSGMGFTREDAIREMELRKFEHKKAKLRLVRVDRKALEYRKRHSSLSPQSNGGTK